MSVATDKLNLTKGKLMTIQIKFDTWEEFDNAIASIATAFISEQEQECARCGEWVKPSEHPKIGCDA